MNTPVSFEIAKLLKDKEFDENCYRTYNHLGTISPFPLLENMGGEPILNPLDYKWKNSLIHPSVITAPTIAEVVMWLYEKRGIWIGVQPTSVVGKFQFRIYYNNKGVMNQDWNNTMSIEYNSPTEAYSAAIEYCLTNLIKK